MAGGGIILLIILIVVISAVVGVIAQFVNKMKEASAPPPRRPLPRADRDATRQSKNDMDRFLAEIDRLRKKNTEGEPAARPRPIQPPPKPAKSIPLARVSRSDRPKAKPRIVAELAEPQQRRRVDTSTMAAPPAPVAPGTLSPEANARPDEFPVAMVMAPSSATGAPATRITRLPVHARPSPKTNLAMNLNGLLGSGQGVAMAIILQEILGPPKARKSGPRG